MSYIPKSALRKIEAANRAIKAMPHRVFDGVEKIAVPFVPTVLSAGQGGAQMWDVFFNGTKQHLCQHADSEQGYIVRYVRGVGNKPQTKETEKLFGIVEIKRKVR